MKTIYNSTEDYINSLPDERKLPFGKLRNAIKGNLPEGFVETMSYGMLSYNVPHSLYPGGYHCDPKQSLPFISMASQKNHIAVYHMGLYSMKDLKEWFIREYPKHTTARLDMGKSCLRFKKPEEIPFELIGKLCTKVTVTEWIEAYEKLINKKK